MCNAGFSSFNRLDGLHKCLKIVCVQCAGIATGSRFLYGLNGGFVRLMVNGIEQKSLHQIVHTLLLLHGLFLQTIKKASC